MIAVFNPLWFAMLAATVAAIPTARLWIREEKTRQKFLGYLGIFAFLYLAVYKFCLSREDPAYFHIWNELPLNLCNINCILVAVAMLADCRPLKAYAFLNGTLGAIIALVFPDPNFTGVPFLSAFGIGYWGFHFLVLFLAAGVVVIGGYRPRYKDLIWALSLLLGSAVIAHLINLLLRATVFEGANYFFTFGLAGNALAETLYALLPVPLLWEVMMLVPVAIVEAVMITLTAPWKTAKERCRS